MGMETMDDILSPAGDFLPWMAWHPGNGDRLGERVYLALISNLHAVPNIVASPGPHSINFEVDGPQIPLHVWQFKVAPMEISSSWQRVVRNFTPVRTFKILKGVLSHTLECLPLLDSSAHRVLLRLPSGKRKQNLHFGP